MQASYLIRFDDICPTMDWTAWNRVEEALIRFDIRPLLAVIPDNRDAHLLKDRPRTDFWRCVREWSRRGWTIGMHGCHHKYVTTDAGIIGKNPFSEFAGLPGERQERLLRRALNIFEREGVKPKIWIAPGHSFDTTTLEVLRELRIRIISDGYALYPYVDQNGMLWIPQQLWSFRALPFGVWTICLHHSEWTAADIARFEQTIERRRRSITCAEEVIAQYDSRPGNVIDRALARAAMARFSAERKLRDWAAPQYGIAAGRRGC